MEFFYENLDLFCNRTPNDIIREWVMHNAMYKEGLSRSRTKSVDLNWPQQWWEAAAYGMLFSMARLIVR